MTTSIEFRARDPGDASTDTDLFDVAPLRDAFERFASGASLIFEDRDGTKIDDYPYGQRVEVQYSTDSGSSWTTRFAGVSLNAERTTRSGIPSVEVPIVGYSHFLTRESIEKDYSSQAKTSILQDVIQNFTPVTYNAGNVNVQDDSAIDLSIRGLTPDEVVAQVASLSANEEWGVNNSFEFFFRQQDSSSAAAITDSDVIEYDLPREGEQAINRFTAYYGSNLSNQVTREDRTNQQDLKDQLGAASGVVIADSDSFPEVSTEDEAAAIAERRLGTQSVVQTGTITVPLGRFDTQSGDVIEVTVSDAGITNTEFRVAQIDYEWVNGETMITIVENSAGDIEELLIALSDSLSNARMRDADPAATETRYLELQSGVTVSDSVSLTTKTIGDGLIVGQSEVGKGTSDLVGGTLGSSSSISIDSSAFTAAFLNLVRDVWQDGNSSFTELTHVAFGDTDTAATRGDNGLANEIDRVTVNRFGAGDNAEEFEFTATLPAGGFWGDAGTLAEFSVADADTAGTHYYRATFPDTTLGGLTRLILHVEGTFETDSALQGVVTSTGQERIRDLVIGESNHEATDMVYGTGTTAAVEGDTALGSKQHEDSLDSTEDGVTGVAKLLERVTAGDADTTGFSEVGVENNANELLQRVVFDAYGSDFVVQTILRLKASNA